MQNETITSILSRRSIRKYSQEPVESGKLELILKAGTYAPTGMGMQSPVIVAVENPEDRRAVMELNCQARGGNGDPYYGAPVIVLVLADPQRHTCVEDGSCVLNTMMLAAHSLGVGNCWIHGEREMFELPKGKALLEKWGLPGTLRGVGALAIGYPQGEAAQAKPRKEDYIKRV